MTPTPGSICQNVFQARFEALEKLIKTKSCVHLDILGAEKVISRNNDIFVLCVKDTKFCGILKFQKICISLYRCTKMNFYESASYVEEYVVFRAKSYKNVSLSRDLKIHFIFTFVFLLRPKVKA